jgi:hypothetical protein
MYNSPGVVFTSVNETVSVSLWRPGQTFVSGAGTQATATITEEMAQTYLTALFPGQQKYRPSENETSPRPDVKTLFDLHCAGVVRIAESSSICIPLPNGAQYTYLRNIFCKVRTSWGNPRPTNRDCIFQGFS